MHNESRPSPCRAQPPNHFIQLADVLTDFFGRYCGVIIYHVGDEQWTEVYRTGRTSTVVSGEAIKALATGSAPPESPDREWTLARTAVPNNSRAVRTTCIQIRDDQGQSSFAFYLQFDATDLFQAYQAIGPLVAFEQRHRTSRHEPAHTVSAEDSITTLFDHAVEIIGKHPATMHTDERLRLVTLLKESGALQFKGAVDHIAALMGVSKYTVYNYLKKIKSLTTDPATTTRG